MTRYYSSTAQPTTLSAAATDVATSIQVAATTGFPAAEFILALDYGTAQQELVKVTGVAGTTLTVTRGFDSTTAQAHSLGAAVQHVHSADDFRLSRTHEAASSGVHGATGALVGTTDAQALSNKDLTSSTNTFPSSLATDAEVTTAVNNHAANTSTHGVTGNIVGTASTQTLSNKTIDLGLNSLNMTKAQLNTAINDADVATLAGTETLTNKTLTTPALTAPTASGDLSGFGGAWTAYTPTLTNFTGTIGHARYLQIGKQVTVHFAVTATGTATGFVDISLPVAFSTSYIASQALGVGVGTGLGSAVLITTGTNRVQFLKDSGTALSTTVVNGTVLSGTVTYEAA